MAHKKGSSTTKIKTFDPFNPSLEVFTKAQATEFKKCAADFNYFSTTYLKCQDEDNGIVRFIPRSYQDKMVDTVIKNRFSIFVAARQCGKSQIIAALLLWYAIFNSEMHIGIAANKMLSAKEIIRRIKFAYEEMPWWLKPAVMEYNKQSIVFDNNSFIEASATTGDGLRSKTLSIIFLDEFAHLKNNVSEDFWTSTFPVISSGKTTKVIITSTPNGTEGMFATLWFGAINGNNGFAHYKVDPNEIPGRDEEYKNNMLKKMTLTKYLQEFTGAFLSSKGTLINSEVLESIKKKDVVSKFRETKFFCDPKNRRLVMGADVGTGIGADYSTIQLFDLETLEQIGEFRNNTMNITQFTKEYIYLLEYLDDVARAKQIYYSVESNSYGQGVINLLLNSNHSVFTRKYVSMISTYKQKLPGIVVSSNTKRNACAKLKALVETGEMKLNSESLLTELKFFVKQGESFKAESGMTDDLVSGCLVIANMLAEISHEDGRLFTKINEVNILTSEEDAGNEQEMPIVF